MFYCVDVGAYCIKAGYPTSSQPTLSPNCLSKPKHEKKHYIGSQLSQCKDLSGILQHRPFEKGYLTNWGLQKDILDTVFAIDSLDNLSETTLLFTEPIFNLPNIQQTYEEILFEEYNVHAILKTSAPQMALHSLGSRIPDCSLVIDCGYSFTHIIPFLNGEPILSGIKRINVGGKLMTNYLKETVSFRYYNMMDETYLINDIKEKCCFVSKDFRADMLASRDIATSNILQQYVLPDFSTNRDGYVLDPHDTSIVQDADQQILSMNNERFTVPEVLFNPSIAGLDQAGIPEVVVEAINATNLEQYQKEMLYSNILVMGGSSQFPGFSKRLYEDLRKVAPTEAVVNISHPEKAQ